MEQKRLLEIRSFEGDGFQPVVQFDSWRIAISNAIETEIIRNFSRHMQTDESFILLRGESALLVAEDKNQIASPTVVPMRLGVVYNVPKGIWHAHRTKAGGQLIIVENADTNENNSETVSVAWEQYIYLAAQIDSALPVEQDIYVL